MSEGNLFLEVAPTLVDNGYELVLIRKGEKRPAEDDWTELHITGKHVAEWARTHPRGNIGIQTRHTPAIDIDVYDADAAAEMESWVLDNIADAPVRVGQAPKRLLVFRTDAPFRKMKSTYIDSAGVAHAIEILGEGQQFVAFGIHPDTKKPFEWVSIETPVDLPVDELPLLSQADAARVLEAFDEMAQRRGWKPKGSKSKAMTTVSGELVDDDDALLNVTQTLDDLDDQDVLDALALVGDHDDYDRWLQVGMALHHQYTGDPRGLEIWHEWSQEAGNYDSDALDAKWTSFSDVRNAGKATTFKTVLMWAKEGAKLKAKDEFERVKNLIASCNDVDELFDGVAAKVAKALVYDHQLEAAAKWLQSRAAEIDGVKRTLAVARKALVAKRLERKRELGDKVPQWVADWVWLEHSDRFYNLNEYVELSIRSFNARYDIQMLTPEDKALGRAIPEVRAADAALTVFDIPKVRKQVYLPGMAQMVELDGELCVNIYDGRMVPPLAEAKSSDQKDALRVVKRHFEILFPDQRERDILISFLAYQVQCPSERVNWGVVIQGVQGAGKTWFQNLMARLLGPKNIGPVNAKSLFSDFNGWAEGRKMIFVEEIRLHGHNRYEVLDNIKTNITNDTIEITRKGRDPYSSPNVTSYMMFTNYQDAIPVDENDRRYFILKTTFQTKRQITTFLRENPTYFDELFDAVAEHPDVLRGWMMGWKLSDEFRPEGRAPDTHAKQHMREVGNSEEHDAIEDLIDAAETPDCTEYLLDITALPNKMQMSGTMPPKTRALRGIVETMGFSYLGRFSVDGEKHRFYTRRPELFVGSATQQAESVRMCLAGQIEPEFL